jgi:hypothetical protein
VLGTCRSARVGGRPPASSSPIAHAPVPALICGCGVEFKRWVTLDDTDENLLRTALLAFES